MGGRLLAQRGRRQLVPIVEGVRSGARHGCGYALANAGHDTRALQAWLGSLVIGPDNFFTSHSEQLAKLTVRHKMPAIYEFREFAAAGGLMSYSSSETEYYRLVGTYAARVLKGDKPADLPVQQSTNLNSS